MGPYFSHASRVFSFPASPAGAPRLRGVGGEEQSCVPLNKGEEYSCVALKIYYGFKY